MLGGVITPNNEKWEPDGADIATMIIFSSITLLIIIAGYWILGLLGSLQKVYSVGGNGWEGKNYEEISQSNHSSNVWIMKENGLISKCMPVEWLFFLYLFVCTAKVGLASIYLYIMHIW